MIETILIYPLIISIILIILKSKWLNNVLLCSYSLVIGYNSLTIYNELINKGKIGYNKFGAYFNIDNLNILFLLVLAIIFIGICFYNIKYVKELEKDKTEHTYYTVSLILFVFSMTGTILSANLGLSWVLLEATTLVSTYLIYINKTRDAIEATWKYIFICSIGIALAFVGIIILSIGMGELNTLFYEELYSNASQIDPFWLNLSFIFILIGIGTKMGLAPIHAWLPDAHSEAPSPISALLSATLLNSAFIIILRMYKLMEITNNSYYPKILLIFMGLLSLFITAIFVFNIHNYKRMLGYSSIENMGIIVIGIAIGGIGIYAALLHLISHSFLKASSFLTAGNILKMFQTIKIDEVRGIIAINNKTGWLWMICMFGILGFPPSPIFISEFLMIKAMLINNQISLLIVFVLLLTIIIYGMSKVSIQMCFGNSNIEIISEKDNAKIKLPLSMYLPQIIFLIFILILGIYIPSNINDLIDNAAKAISLM
ncbi:MAG: proton-conducting transporter membrane subunit [Vampirovibrionia bacterium]